MYRISRRWVDLLIVYFLLFWVVCLALCDFWQLIRSSSVWTFVSNFVRSPPTMQPFVPCDPETKRQPSQYKSPNSPRPKKARQVKINAKSMLIIFFDIKVIVDEEFVLACQTVNSAYYCDFTPTARKCAKTSSRTLGTKKELAVASRQRTTVSRFLFRHGIFFFFTKNNLTVVSHPPYSSALDPCDLCFPDWK
jgi:hypothetical protein